MAVLIDYTIQGVALWIGVLLFAFLFSGGNASASLAHAASGSPISEKVAMASLERRNLSRVNRGCLTSGRGCLTFRE
jgi:hypothetical protein